MISMECLNKKSIIHICTLTNNLLSFTFLFISENKRLLTEIKYTGMYDIDIRN